MMALFGAEIGFIFFCIILTLAHYCTSTKSNLETEMIENFTSRRDSPKNLDLTLDFRHFIRS